MNDKYITFFVSTDAHDRLIRRMWKKIGQSSKFLVQFMLRW